MSTLDYLKEAGRKEGEDKKSTEFVKNLLLTNQFSISQINKNFEIQYL